MRPGLGSGLATIGGDVAGVAKGDRRASIHGSGRGPDLDLDLGLGLTAFTVSQQVVGRFAHAAGDRICR